VKGLSERFQAGYELLRDEQRGIRDLSGDVYIPQLLAHDENTSGWLH